MDSARSLFEEIVSDGWAYLQNAKAEQREEHYLLDFKRIERDRAPMETGDRKLLAEALSGFANSDGGVIVWGVDCRSGRGDEPDVVQELKPIQNLKRLMSDLQSGAGQLVSPGIVGVEHVPIEDPHVPGAGYAVTYVPKGQGDPHMAIGRDQHRYYYRAGTSFLRMEASMVADRFGRRPQPKLEFAWRFELGARSERGFHTRIVIGIRNVGAGVALYPAIAIAEVGGVRLDIDGLDGYRHTGLPERPRTPVRREWVDRQGHFDPPPDSFRFFAGGVDHVIHPGTTLEVTRTTKEFMRNSHPVATARRLHYELFCQGFAGKGLAEISVDDFQRFWADHRMR